MLKNIQKKIKELHMIQSEDTVLTGVSGGADSVCLLLLLSVLREDLEFVLEAVHVEHGIRGEESRQDAVFVEALCQRLQIPLHTVSVDVPAHCDATGLGVEEAARSLRYEVFRQLAVEKHAKVALAHHMEDNAETMLFQFVRGSSLTGLCGMQPIRKDDWGVTYIRPLLYARRADIEDYLKVQGQEYREDSTNAQLEYCRNYIRGVILPELEHINPQAVMHMNAAARQLTDIREYLLQETKKAWEQVVIPLTTDGVEIAWDAAEGIFVLQEETESRTLNVNIDRLMQLHVTLQREILYRAIAYMAGGKKDISLVHVTELLDLCNNQSGRQIHLPGGILAQKEYQQLQFFYKEVELKKNQDIFPEKGQDICVLGEMLEQCPLEIPLHERGEQIRLSIFPYEGKNIEIPQKTYTKWMDYDKIKSGFCIRTRRSGDVFIGDAEGHRKKLKQYFIDEKIPASKRENMWLLAQDDVVLWLIGGRMSEHVKVTADTKTIIEITYDGGC